jgi:hypothetical protein
MTSIKQRAMILHCPSEDGGFRILQLLRTWLQLPCFQESHNQPGSP